MKKTVSFQLLVELRRRYCEHVLWNVELTSSRVDRVVRVVRVDRVDLTTRTRSQLEQGRVI